MLPRSDTSPDHAVRDRLNQAVARQFFNVGALLCLLGSASLLLQDLPLSPVAKLALAAACALMAGLFALASWKADAIPAKWSVLGTAWSGCTLVTLVTTFSGFGIQSHDLGFFGLIICLVAVLTGKRHAVIMSVFAGATIVALAGAEAAGWLQGRATAGKAPLSDPVVSQLLLLGAGLAVGLIVSRVAQESLAGYAEREGRFQALLKMAADRYWELDADLRFVQTDTPASSLLGTPPPGRMGLRPWETIDKLGIAPEHQSQHFDDLRACRPFSRLRTCVTTPEGAVLHLSTSGVPRFDGDGRFAGYWGVSRIMNHEVAAELALRRSEAMLTHLIETCPDCITLTDADTGMYRMVNATFTRVLGYGAEEVKQRSSIDLGIWYSNADREAFAERLRDEGSVRELRCLFVAKSGARVAMMVSATRCVIDGRDSIVINARDVTDAERERLEYAAILQRASIGIAFTRERHFARANPCFEHMFGWDSGTMAGQSGRVVWPSDTDYGEIGRLAGPLLELGQPVQFERQMLRKDGSLFWCRLLAQALDPSETRNGGTIWIAEDVTKRHQTEKALADAKDAAEAASRAKSAFLANTSHEIRTPLNGLLGMARLALQHDVDPALRRQYLNHILDSAENLAGIISDILDLSKVEAGRIDLERVNFGLNEMLASLHQAYQPTAEGKGLSLTLAMGAGVPPFVTGDPMRVRQILSNFITNALKFTERGQVRIEASCKAPGCVRLAVVDSGPGIGPAVQARLFQPFSQADESTTRRFGGTGLGLSICRELARLMGGEVGLSSQPGEGSTFWAELPLQAAQAASAQHESAAPDPTHLRGVRVLVAEDNPVNMLITAALLEHWGMLVTQANDGAAAIEAVRAAARMGQPFGVVLMDMHMPQLSGYAAARLLRQEYPAVALPIIALTAAALVSERDEALQAGMCDFLTKPIDAQRMRQVLAQHVAQAATA